MALYLPYIIENPDRVMVWRFYNVQSLFTIVLYFLKINDILLKISRKDRLLLRLLEMN